MLGEHQNTINNETISSIPTFDKISEVPDIVMEVNLSANPQVTCKVVHDDKTTCPAPTVKAMETTGSPLKILSVYPKKQWL